MGFKCKNNELIFYFLCKNYMLIWKYYMMTNVTNHLPIQFKDLLYQTKLSFNAEPDMISHPNINCRVIFRALNALNDIIDDKERLELKGIEKGSKWTCRYEIIKPYLLKGKIELI